jgi:hypothetical protein
MLYDDLRVTKACSNVLPKETIIINLNVLTGV